MWLTGVYIYRSRCWSWGERLGCVSLRSWRRSFPGRGLSHAYGGGSLAGVVLTGQEDYTVGDFAFFDHLGGSVGGGWPNHVVQDDKQLQGGVEAKASDVGVLYALYASQIVALWEFQLYHYRNDEDSGREKEGFKVCLGFDLWRVRIHILAREHERVARGTHIQIYWK